MKYSLSITFVFTIFIALGQNSKSHFVLTQPIQDGSIYKYELPSFSKEKHSHIAWTVEKRRGETFDIFYKKDGRWILLMEDGHQKDDYTWYSNLMFSHPETKEIELKYNSKSNIRPIIHLLLPGKSSLMEKSKEIQEECDLPEHISRPEWCSDCPGHPSPEFTEVTHLIVHHSAGTNASNDWASVVKSIWQYHVLTRGWSDIGYNWLVAPDGTLFKGRGDNIKGAHFCAKNGNTMGVCVMGNYEEVEPKQPQIDKLIELLSWKCVEKGIDPVKRTFHPLSGKKLGNISGHRDGCATACPGNILYAKMDSLRIAVRNRFDDCGGVVSGVQSVQNIQVSIINTIVPDKIRFDNPKHLSFDVKIYNQLGNLVIYRPRFIQNELICNSLVKGVYFVDIQVGINRKITKIMKVN